MSIETPEELEALRRGIAAARAGARLRDVGAAVERVVEARGAVVLRDLHGHGVGRTIHEPPEVPSWGAPWAEERLTEGLVITIEPIIGAGGREVVDAGDGWPMRIARRALRARGAHDRRHGRSAARAHRSLSRAGPLFITSARPHQAITQAGQK
jgi:methionine aminopeptidase